MTLSIKLTPGDLREIIESWVRERYRGEVTEVTFNVETSRVGSLTDDEHIVYRFTGATISREVE